MSFYGHQTIPQVTGNDNFFYYVGVKQAMVTVDNYSMVEFPYDLPERCNLSWLNRSGLMLMDAWLFLINPVLV